MMKRACYRTASLYIGPIGLFPLPTCTTQTRRLAQHFIINIGAQATLVQQRLPSKPRLLRGLLVTEVVFHHSISSLV